MKEEGRLLTTVDPSLLLLLSPALPNPRPPRWSNTLARPPNNSSMGRFLSGLELDTFLPSPIAPTLEVGVILPPRDVADDSQLAPPPPAPPGLVLPPLFTESSSRGMTMSPELDTSRNDLCWTRGYGRASLTCLNEVEGDEDRGA